jgi:hypothetical protein
LSTYKKSKEFIWLETDAKLFFDKEVPLKVQTSSRDISKRKADLIVKTHSDKNVNYMNYALI